MADDALSYRIHGIAYSDSESDQEGKDHFDEEYYSLKPPPLKYEDIKDKIIHIPPKIPVIVNVWEERKKKMLQSKADEQSNVNETVDKQSLNQINIASLLCMPKENYEQSDVTSNSGVVPKKSKKNKKKNKKQVIDSSILNYLDQRGSENHEQSDVTDISGVVTKKSKKNKQLTDESKSNSLVQGSSDKSNKEDAEPFVLYSKMVKKKNKNAVIPDNPVDIVKSEHEVQDCNKPQVLPRKINEGNLNNYDTTVVIANNCNGNIGATFKKRSAPFCQLNDVQLRKINETLDTLLPNHMKRTDLNNAQEELEYYKKRDSELYKYWHETLKSVRINPADISENINPTITNNNSTGIKNDERLKEGKKYKDCSCSYLESLTRNKDEQEKCPNYQSKVKPLGKNVLQTIYESDKMESREAGCLHLENILKQNDIINNWEDILVQPLAAKSKKKRKKKKNKNESASTDEARISDKKEDKSTGKELMLSTNTNNIEKDSTLIYFPVECAEENDVYKRKIAKLQLDKLRSERNICYYEFEGNYLFKPLDALAANRIDNDEDVKSGEYNIKMPKLQLDEELRNETNIFYYEFLGKNFEHFLDFRETYLFKSLDVLAAKRVANDEEVKSGEYKIKMPKLQLDELRNETKIFYYEYLGKNSQHFLDFRETYLYKSLDALAAERVGNGENEHNEYNELGNETSNEILAKNFQGFLESRETNPSRSLDTLAEEGVWNNENSQKKKNQRQLENNKENSILVLSDINSQVNNVSDSKLNVNYTIIIKIVQLVCLTIIINFGIATLNKIHLFVKDNFIQILLTLVSVVILYILNVK